jgi:biotin carboxylase
VVKPTNLSGGRGVDIVQNQEELNTSIKDALKVSDEIFLEEYIQGKLIAYSVFIQNQKIVYAFSGVDDTYLNPYLITTAYPIKLDIKVEQRLIKDIHTIAQKLDFVDGMFHLQLIIKDNLPYIIDVTRRIPGDFYPYLIEQSNEVEYSKAVVKAYIGDTITDEFKNKANNFIIRHVVMPKKNGIYQNLMIDDHIKSKITYRFDLVEYGSKITNYLSTQLSILFIQEDKDILNSFNQNIKVIIDG